MSREKPSPSPGPRDTTLARMVAAALESQVTADGAACPDADLLAAYAEHTLDAGETSRWEAHFADCARCQQVLAVLTVSAEDPLTHQEIARLGQLVGKAAVPIDPTAPAPEIARPAKEPRSAPRAAHHSPWSWLVPAFGVAAAAALWFALRPTSTSVAPSDQIMAERTAVPPPPGQQPQPSPRNAPREPVAAASAKNAPASALARQEAPSLDRKTAPQAAPAKEEAPAGQVKQKDASRGEVSDLENKKAASAAASGVGLAVPAAPPMPVQQTQAVTAAGGAPAVATANGAVGGALQAQAQQPAASGVAGRGSAGAAGESALKPLPLNGRNFAATAKLVAAPVVFATPDRAVEWRIGAGGRIERSTDQGATWQPQSSGVTSDLLAGAAVSAKIAWIVGRAGVILRTTDGEHWLRATPPPMPPINSSAGSRADAITSVPDWSGIEATDALHATVVSSGGLRYATSDGGRTWTPQP